MRLSRATSRAGLLGAFFTPVMLLAGIGVLMAPYHAQAQPTPAATPQPYAEFGRIETELHQVREPNCGTLIVRGRFRNPYNEPVDGIRFIVRLLSAGEKPREFDRMEADVPITIAPRGSAPFNRELSTSCSAMFSSLTFVAFAEHRGAADLPTPSRQVEVAASKIREGESAMANIPMVNQPGGIFNFTFSSMGH